MNTIHGYSYVSYTCVSARVCTFPCDYARVCMSDLITKLIVFTDLGIKWQNCTIFCSGEPVMDLTHRAMLNDFGLVQQAVLKSSDHNAVHVIHGHNHKQFVHTELTKELETRTGLQLVPPQSRVATSLSKQDGLVIVIGDSHDSLTDWLLREAVKTAGHPDTHTLFLQKGKYRPDWFDNKLPPSTLMVYPESDRERSQFWTTLTTMIGE